LLSPFLPGLIFDPCDVCWFFFIIAGCVSSWTFGFFLYPPQRRAESSRSLLWPSNSGSNRPPDALFDNLKNASPPPPFAGQLPPREFFPHLRLLDSPGDVRTFLLFFGGGRYSYLEVQCTLLGFLSVARCEGHGKFMESGTPPCWYSSDPRIVDPLMKPL